MAPRGSKKALSVEQEEFVAQQFGGTRSKSSGASDTDKGDVRVTTGLTMFECKGKFGERTGQKPVRSTLLSDFEKLADEAYAASHDPALALRFYKPDSPLADTNGYVDLVVRRLADDLERECGCECGCLV